MISEQPHFVGIKIRISNKTPIKGRVFINQGSGLGIARRGLGFRAGHGPCILGMDHVRTLTTQL